MAMCVLYNPNDVYAKAIVVNVPSTANMMYAFELAKKERKKNPQYTAIECNVNVIGNEDEAKWIGFVKRGFRFIPVAVSNDASNIVSFYGSNAIVAPLERLLVTSLNELLALV